MRPLAEYEEEVMNSFQESGALSVRDVVALHDESRLGRTTVATFMKLLEQKGYLDHKVESTDFIYFPITEREDYCGQNLKSAIRRYSDSSIRNVVNFPIKSEGYSDEEAKGIILQMSNRGKEQQWQAYSWHIHYWQAPS